MSLKQKKKRERVHDELLFGDGCQAAHGDSHLMVRAAPWETRLGTGCAQAVLLTCLFSTLCLASVALIGIRSRRVPILCMGGGLG